MTSITPIQVQQAFELARGDIQASLQGLCDVSLFDGRQGGYKAGTEAIAACRTFRTRIEDRRKFLKQDSLEYGRLVDKTAAELVALVKEFEEPMRTEKERVDTAKAEAKAAAARAEEEKRQAELREKMRAEEEELRAKRQEEERSLELRRREIARMKEQAQAEADRERAALEEERKAAALERGKILQERRELDAEKAKHESEKRAKEIAERMVAEAEEARIHQLEYERQKQERLAALAPDLERVRAYGRSIRDFALTQPAQRACRDPLASEAISTAYHALLAIAESLEAFEVPA